MALQFVFASRDRLLSVAQKTLRSLSLSLAIISCLGSVQAGTVYTDTATLDVAGQLPAVGPPIPLTSLMSLSDTGRLYANSLGANVAGVDVRATGASLLATVKHAGGAETSAPIGSSGQALILVFGLSGEFTSSTDIAFSDGLLRLLELPAGAAFVADDPTTWTTGATLLASYQLTAAMDVADGNTLSPPMGDPEALTLAADDVNVSGVNTAVGSTSQTTLLFDKLAPSLLTSDSGLASLFALAAEGSLAILDQELLESSNFALATTAEDALNQISMDSIGLPFADFNSNGFANFVPETSAGLVTDSDGSGFDYVVNLGGSLTPTITAVPEPSSIGLVCGLLAGLVASSCRVARKRW